jgi:hypothetical protein
MKLELSYLDKEAFPDNGGRGKVYWKIVKTDLNCNSLAFAIKQPSFRSVFPQAHFLQPIYLPWATWEFAASG